VVLTHEAVAAHARAASARLEVDAARDRWLACLPLAHVGGLGVVVRALVTGTPLVVHPGLDPRAVEEEARRGATLVSLVPTALVRGVDVSGFRRVLLGGAAPLGPVPANVVATWGSTETGGGVVYDGVPLDGVEVRVAADGEVGVRGPTSLRAYRDGTDPRDGDGWLATGDAGHLDGEGRLVVEGRLSDKIVTGGENVWPAAVEAAVRRHPDVADVVVAGRPDPEWGERVVAWVVSRAGVAIPTLDALRALVGEHVAPWAAPRELVLVESLPRGPGGKVSRDRLPSPR
jgi:O-succinylbenzoic acid--CoA ligase